VEEFLRYVIRELVEFPEEVAIAKTELPQRIIFQVAMRQNDLGRIIGRGGHTVEALRRLLNAAANKRGIRASLQILE
jgi:predicted RNA-binding protein YlqC (UPF0109 family)